MSLFIRLVVLVLISLQFIGATNCERNLSVTWLPPQVKRIRFESYSSTYQLGTIAWAELDKQLPSSQLYSLVEDAVHASMGVMLAAGLAVPLRLTQGTQVFLGVDEGRHSVIIYLPSVTPNIAAVGGCDVDRTKPLHVNATVNAASFSGTVEVRDSNFPARPHSTPEVRVRGVAPGTFRLVSETAATVLLPPWITLQKWNAGSVYIHKVDTAVLPQVSGLRSLQANHVATSFEDFEPAGDILYTAAVSVTWHDDVPLVTIVSMQRRLLPDFSMPLNAFGLTLAGVVPALSVIFSRRVHSTSLLSRLIAALRSFFAPNHIRQMLRRSPAPPWGQAPPN